MAQQQGWWRRGGATSEEDNDLAKLTQRALRFAADEKAKGSRETLLDLRKRSACGGGASGTETAASGYAHAASDVGGGAAAGEVYGRSTALEKQYLRLTSAPTADSVRPPDVLRRALALVLERWQQGAEYAYCCDQLKAIRQDLTVQRVRGRLAVQVYESHARVALAAGDCAEFRGCHVMLRELYADGAPGDPPQFAALGLLYALLHGRALLGFELRSLQRQELADPRVRHALQVCRSYLSGSYTRFWSLYETAPSPECRALMGTLAASLRPKVYQSMLRAFAPTLPLDVVKANLGFNDDQQAANEFIAQQQGVVVGNALDIKASRAAAAS